MTVIDKHYKKSVDKLLNNRPLAYKPSNEIMKGHDLDNPTVNSSKTH